MIKKAIIKIQDEINALLIGLDGKAITTLFEHFGLFTGNHFFSPKFKLGIWDGKIRFFTKTGQTYVQLLPEIIPILKKLGWTFELIDNRKSWVIDIPPIDKNYFSAYPDPRFPDKPLELGEHQVKAINIATQNNIGMIIAGTGAGKAQPLYSKVLTPRGWKAMGDLVVGDKVLTPKNTHSKVVGIFPQGVKPVYRITFNDGTFVDSSDEHLWECHLPEKDSYTVPSTKRHRKTKFIKTTSELKELFDFYKSLKINNHGKKHTSNFSKNISIDLPDPLEFDDNSSNGIDLNPYILGCLIGDGSLKNTPMITNVDNEIIEYFNQWAADNDMSLKGSGISFYITNKERTRKNSYIFDHLNALGLKGKLSHEKFIPSQYMFASLETRKAVLQGLLDTDGTIDTRGRITFTTSSEQLSTDVSELVRSLGGIAKLSTKTPTFTYKGVKKTGKLAYIIQIAFKHEFIPFRLSRKIARWKERNLSRTSQLNKTITAIDFLQNDYCQCIMIDDPDHLYITDGFTITHNTIITAALCSLYKNHANFKCIIIVPTADLVKQTVSGVAKYGNDVGRYDGKIKDINHDHLVSTWQALKNNPNLVALYQVVIVDECHGVRGTVIRDIINNAGGNIPVKIGLTGTLPKDPCEIMNIRISLGNVLYTVPAHELITKGWLAALKLRIVNLIEDMTAEWEEYKLKYPVEAKKLTYKKFKKEFFPDYNSEKNFLKRKQSRNEFIVNLVDMARVRGNCLVLTSGIPFGKKLAGMIPNAYFIYGKDDDEVRKEIYDLFKTHNDIVVVTNYQIASTGLDIPRIFNLFLVDSGNSFIRVIQSIGRGLRKASDKDTIFVYDIASDLAYSHDHLLERKKYYNEQQYEFKQDDIDYANIDLT